MSAQLPVLPGVLRRPAFAETRASPGDLVAPALPRQGPRPEVAPGRHSLAQGAPPPARSFWATMRHMGTRLEGRVAIVTGGGHGIGRAYCLALAREGARVVVAEIDGKAAEATSELVWGEGVETLALQTDVADEASTLAMARATVERFGRIDVLVNNAAVFATIPISRALIEEISVAEWDRVMAVNLRGVFLACRAVLPVMKAAGAGRIINISSGTAFNRAATRIHYVASGSRARSPAK